MRLSQLLVITAIGLIASATRAEDPLFTVSSKDHGLPFDLVVTETKREDFKSFLSVPGFHKRSAAGSRWLMCAYTDLATKRGFKFWAVVYPDESSDTLVLGFPLAPTADLKALFGSDYAAARTLPATPVEVMARTICAKRGNRVET